MDDEALFTRQRRNLILISVFLLFAVYLDLNVSKLNFLGNELVMPSPRSVQPILWVLWGYFLIRYWQVFSWNPVRAEMRRHLYSTLVVEAWRQFNGAMAGKKVIRRPLGYAPGTGTQPSAMEVFEDAMMAILPDRAIVRIWYSSEKDDGMSVGEREIHIDGARYQRLRWWARVTAQFNTPVFTEHLLPFVIAFVPAIALGMRAQCL